MIINQQKVEKAVKVLENLQAVYNGVFPKEMKGDISSFGASIIQAGLLPSVLFFSEGNHREKPKKDGDEDTKVRRAKLMKVVFDMLEVPDPDISKYSGDRPLLDYVRQNLSNSTTALDNITEAALAVKVALRAFKFAEKETKPSTANDPTT